MDKAPAIHDFDAALKVILDDARNAGRVYVEVVSGDLHRAVGGYPGKNHVMPTCCNAMRKAMGHGDQILCAPPKGNGATLKVRYYVS